MVYAAAFSVAQAIAMMRSEISQAIVSLGGTFI